MLLINADRFVVVHNHPTGDVNPSDGDINTTQKLIEMSETMGFILDESLIVAKNNHTSIREIINKKFIDSLPVF